MEQFLLGLASGVVLTLFAEALRLRGERKRRRQDAIETDRLRLAALVGPVRRAIDSADGIWIGMMSQDSAVEPRSLPLDDHLRAIIAAWDHPTVGPLINDTKVRDAYSAARIGMWAKHWEWLRNHATDPEFVGLHLSGALGDDPEVPAGLEPVDRACWYSAKHISVDLQAFRQEMERYVPLY